ncbi:hypothetical protein [Acetobacter orleanensis]|nr:hypothetical protein [Acetobacter orleanensis]KXV66899.1 hypothetical protein AD949_01130 [Acetobacter orleanensis]PCD78364.1 hypothetical protein CO710_12735 [Acetobacter orleanensis]GBR24252.1 hypothetical protein AA0473_0586 [Acetobacter orleanensis NRIC 0473]
MAQMNGCFQRAIGIFLYNWVYILVQQCDAKILIRVSEEEKRMIRELSGGNMSAWVREAALSRMASERHVELMLDRQSGTERQLADIKKMLMDGIKTRSNETGSSESEPLPVELVSCVFESLYLLRLVVQKTQRDQAKSAIERLGLPYIYNEAIKDVAAKAK